MCPCVRGIQASCPAAGLVSSLSSPDSHGELQQVFCWDPSLVYHTPSMLSSSDPWTLSNQEIRTKSTWALELETIKHTWWLEDSGDLRSCCWLGQNIRLKSGRQRLSHRLRSDSGSVLCEQWHQPHLPGQRPAQMDTGFVPQNQRVGKLLFCTTC